MDKWMVYVNLHRLSQEYVNSAPAYMHMDKALSALRNDLDNNVLLTH